ncbi:MAG: transglutaminaseTgpA domain-containing protein [Caulobacteraceae bacterium]
MKNRDIKELIFYIIIIFLIVMSLNLAIMDSTGMSVPLFKIALYTLAIVISTAGALIFPAALLPIIAAGLVWLTYMYFTNPELKSNIWTQAVGFFNWVYGYIVGYNFFEEKYSYIFAIIYIVLTVLLVSLITFSGKGGFMLILLGAAALTFFWFIYVEKARLYLILFLLASIMLYSYHVYKKKLKEWKQSQSIVAGNVGFNWMLSSALIISAAILLTLALPLNISPVRWEWFNNKVISIFPFIAEWRNDSEDTFGYGFNSRYSLSSAGYKGRRLGGAIMMDNSVMMTVKTDSKETLYLRGAVKDKYTGFSWNKTNSSYKEYNSGYPMEIPYSKGISTYEKNLEITHKKLLTSTIFAPYSIYEVQDSAHRIYADENSEVYSSKLITGSEPYIVKSLTPYIDPEKLKKVGFEELGGQEKKQYTELPNTITDRVKKLANDITKDYNNNFDKAMAIESYLRGHYKYTLEPSRLPDRREFVDYFLFEGKEGYCTYYATSMAVLLRASGIPGRYVEGFISRYEGSAVRNVRGTDAHAWAEAYFDGYGWITFEATPQYPVLEFKKPEAVVEETKIETEQSTAEVETGVSGISGRRRDLEDMEDETGGTGAEGGSRRVNKGFVSIVSDLFILILFLRFLYLFIKWMVREVSLGKYKDRRYTSIYIKDVLWYLQKVGFVSAPDETLRELMERVRHNYKERFPNIDSVTDIVEKIRYGKAELNAEDKRALEGFRKSVKRLALRKAGVVKLFADLYILGR